MDLENGGSTAPAEDHSVELRARDQLHFMQKVFRISLPDDVVPEKAELRAEIMKNIEANSEEQLRNIPSIEQPSISASHADMKVLYQSLCTEHGWICDSDLEERMSKAITEKLEKLDAAIQDARDNFGDVEVLDRQREKAEWIASTGDREGALKAYGEMNEKSLSTGQKIDIAMSKARLAMQHSDWLQAKDRTLEAKDLNEKGGDWDRRNRLKVYEGLQSIAVRDFSLASSLLLDSVATFTAIELLDYKDFVFYAVLTTLKTLDRVSLKKRVIDSPDVLSVIDDIPHLTELLNSFYECRYSDFLRALTDIYPSLVRDRYISRHAPYYLREMRLAAYVQFLESYKSVTMAGMAKTFGISVPFLDGELSRFIAAGRLNAKIDAVEGIIETTRPDAKNAQYHAVIKQGDALLNKIQKLSRVVAM